MGSSTYLSFKWNNTLYYSKEIFYLSMDVAQRFHIYYLCYICSKLLMRLFSDNVQEMKFSVKDLSNKCDQIRSFLWIWLHLQEKSLIKNFIFCAVKLTVLAETSILLQDHVCFNFMLKYYIMISFWQITETLN